MKMIFSECPYCNEPQVFGWEAGDLSGWFPSKCSKCKKVMWVKGTSFDSETVKHAQFKEIAKNLTQVYDENRIEMMASEAAILSQVIYD
jgi:hypothetical protein